MPTTAAPDPTAPVDGTPTRRPRRRAAVVAGVVVVALAAGVTGVVALLGHREDQAAAQATRDEAVAELDQARQDFEDWIDAGHANTEPQGGWVDQALIDDLVDVLERAEAFDTTEPTTGSLAEQADAAEDLRDDVLALTDEVIENITTVGNAQYFGAVAVEQEKYDSALAGLDAALAAADQALAAGTGTPEARDAVTTAVAEARAVRDAERDFEDIDVVINGWKDLATARSRVEAAVGALGA